MNPKQANYEELLERLDYSAKDRIKHDNGSETVKPYCHLCDEAAQAIRSLQCPWVGHKPEEITEEGFYFDPAEDEFLKIELIEQLVYGPLKPRFGIDNPDMAIGTETSLHCLGYGTAPEGWPNPLYGPISPPYPLPPAPEDQSNE